MKTMTSATLVQPRSFRARGTSLLLSLAASVILCSPAMATHTVKEGLTVEDLPPTAQAAVKKELDKGSTLRVIHAITEAKDGRTWFLARFVADSQPVEINFDPKGNVTSVEREVSLDSLPAVVLAAVHKVVPPDPKLKMVEADTEADGDVSYVVRSGGRALTFDEKGKVVETVTKTTLAALPSAIRDGIHKSVGKGELIHDDEVEAITEKGVTTYAVDVRTDGLRSKVYVDSKGRYVK